MTEQRCGTCEYFSLEDDPIGDGAGDCCWVTRNTIPDCCPFCGRPITTETEIEDAS